MIYSKSENKIRSASCCIIDVIEVLVNAFWSIALPLDFNIMDISIYLICFKIRLNPKVGRFYKLDLYKNIRNFLLI